MTIRNIKKNKLLVAIPVVFVLVLCGWLFVFQRKEQPLVLETERPVRGPIYKRVTATGKIQPVDTVSVGTQVSGTIKSLFADFNSVVKKGQLLAELDKSLFQAQVDQSQASLESAKSELAYQQNNFERQQLLYEEGVISKADYEHAVYGYESARAHVRNIEAQLRSANQNLAFTAIYSPIDGVVLGRNVSVGQTVAASFNTPTLFVIAKDITEMQVQANIDEADIGGVQAGQRAIFTVDAYIGDTFRGKVREIRLQPSVSSNVVTYTTMINTANEDEKLMPGMTATVTIYTQEEENALLIPAEALKFKPPASLAPRYTLKGLPPADPNRTDTSGGNADSFVWIKKDDTLVQKSIRTGINNNTQVQVLEGLSMQDEVITKAPFSAKAASEETRNPFLPKNRPGGGGGG